MELRWALRIAAAAKCICALFFIAAACSAPARAAYSGLLIIPTADIIEPNTYELNLQLDGNLAGRQGDTFIINTQHGISPRLEFGVDFDWSEFADNRIAANFKYLAVTGTETRPAVAFGVSGFGPYLKSNPYVAASHNLGAFRGHAGIIGTAGYARWFAGADKALSDRLCLMAEHTNGEENASAVGISYSFTDRFNLTAGVIFPNRAEDSSRFSLQFIFSGSREE